MRSLLVSLLVVGCLPSQPSGVGAITAPDRTWTWVEFSNTQCANGSPTGLGFNPASSDDVVIYLMGGGACWDASTCYLVKSAWNVELGYTAGTFTGDAFRSIPLFDRALASNPFKDASFVSLPYCTGDLHVGTTEQSYVSTQPTRHHGAKNLDAFLERLAPTFTAAKRVFVVGTSAGGFGAQMNAWKFAKAFPNGELHVLADSAAIVAPSSDRWAAWIEAWRPELPPGCAACASEPLAWVASAKATLSKRGRLGLITAEEDGLLSSFTQRSGAEFRAGVHALTTQHFDGSHAAAYVVPGSRHVFLNDWAVIVNGVGLGEWLGRFHDGVDFASP